MARDSSHIPSPAPHAHVPLLYALLCSLLAASWARSLTSGVAGPPGDHLVRLVPPVDLENDTDVARLSAGQPVLGALGRGGQRVLRFGVTEVPGVGFPDVALWLRPVGGHGNADLRCGPWPAAAQAGGRPASGEYPWVSADAHGLDAVLLAANTEEYRSAVTTVNAALGDGAEGPVAAAAFMCVIEDKSTSGTRFSLELGLAPGGLRLAPDQREALRGIFGSCCATGEACAGWPEGAGDEGRGGAAAFDVCGVPGNACDLQGRLAVLRMRGYGLECHFPFPEMGALSTLEKLDVGENPLSGEAAEVFDGLAGMGNLTHVGLSSTGLHGSLTDARGLCAMAAGGLQVLELRDADIDGEFPGCLLAAGSSLLEVDLSRNALTGSLPDVVPVDSSLEVLAVAENSMTGTLPASLVENGRMLSRLNLTGNSLTGSVPESLGGLAFLTTFLADSNKLTTLPGRWSDTEGQIFQALSVFNLSGNLLEGSFPAALGRADSLDVLDLSDNKLGGPLPDEEGLFPTLNHLNISFNAFEGPIHESWLDIGMFSNPIMGTAVGVLDVRSNNLSGELPDFLFTDSALYAEMRRVYVGGNNFTCPTDAGLESIVVDGCGNGTMFGSEDLNEGANHTVRKSSEEQVLEATGSSKKSAIGNGTLAGPEDAGLAGGNSTGRSSGANLVAAIVVVLVAGALFGGIMAFVRYWHRKQREPRDRLVRHLKFHDDFELQGLQ